MKANGFVYGSGEFKTTTFQNVNYNLKKNSDMRC